MSSKRFKVRVFVKSDEVGKPGQEDGGRSFAVDASNADLAAAEARKRLAANQLDVVSLSHSPERVITVTIRRELLPKPLIANSPRRGAK